jgi:hypothetical protein
MNPIRWTVGGLRVPFHIASSTFRLFRMRSGIRRLCCRSSKSRTILALALDSTDCFLRISHLKLTRWADHITAAVDHAPTLRSRLSACCDEVKDLPPDKRRSGKLGPSGGRKSEVAEIPTSQEVRASLCRILCHGSMAGMRTRVTIIGMVALAALLYAVKFSPHPIRWLIGLIAAVPLSAAIAGGLPQDEP